MNNVTDITARAEEAAKEASKPGTFSFLDRLASRNYPTVDVVIYIDEVLGHKMQKLREKIETSTNAEEMLALEAEFEAVREEAKESRYIVRLQGISSEEYDSTIDTVEEAYPMEYTTEMHPITFQRTKEPVLNSKREDMFRILLWSKFIKAVTAPDGSVDDNISPEWVASFMQHVPVWGLIRIREGVEELRMTTNWMDHMQGEDFFPKS